MLPSLIVADTPYCLVSPASRLALLGHMLRAVTVGADGTETETELVSAGPAALLPITLKVPAADPAV